MCDPTRVKFSEASSPAWTPSRLEVERLAAHIEVAQKYAHHAEFHQSERIWVPTACSYQRFSFSCVCPRRRSTDHTWAWFEREIESTNMLATLKREFSFDVKWGLGLRGALGLKFKNVELKGKLWSCYQADFWCFGLSSSLNKDCQYAQTSVHSIPTFLYRPKMTN